MFGTSSAGGEPDRAHCSAQRGRSSTSGAKRAIVRASSCAGIVGLPQSRACEYVQSSVRMSPATPAARARSTRASIASREPAQ